MRARYRGSRRASPHVLLTDEPTIVRHPRRTVRLVAGAYAVGIVAAACAAAYAGGVLGYGLSARHTDGRIASVERQLAAAHRDRDRLLAAAAGERERQRRAVCALLARARPDRDVDAARDALNCGPSLWRPSSSGSPVPDGAVPLDIAPQPSPGPTSSSPRPSPAPTRARPSPAASPASPVCLLGVCI